MKAIKSLLTLVTLIMFFSTCTENDNDNVEPGPISADSVDVPLTDDQAAFLETVKDTVIRLEDIVLENGQNVRSFLETNDPGFLEGYPSGRVAKSLALTPREQKLKFLARMYAMGNYLVDDDQHTYPSAGADSPAQTGLAYSWGSKDYNIRQVPPTASGCMNLKIYGLDCTGMIWAMTQAANLTVVPKYNFFVKYISNADKWTAAFKASADYKDLKMKDMGQLAKEKIKNGDIILWGSHVGVYLYGSFYQSNGNPNKPSCNDNLDIGRGPRFISLSKVLSWGFGSYKVFRIIYGEDYTVTVDLTGTNIALATAFNFDYSDNGSFLVTVYENRDTVEVSSIINSHGKVESLTSIPPCTGSPSNQGDLLNIQSVRGYVIRTPGEPGKVLLEIHSAFIFFPYIYECGTGTSQSSPGNTFESTYTMEWFPIDGAAHTYTTTGFNVAGEVVTMTATPQ